MAGSKDGVVCKRSGLTLELIDPLRAASSKIYVKWDNQRNKNNIQLDRSKIF